MEADIELDGTELRKTAATIAISVGTAVGISVAWAIWHASGHITRMAFDRVVVLQKEG